MLPTANKQYIERLQLVINQLHGCDSKWAESVPVHKVFRSQTVWQGTVKVFDLIGHPKAKRAYGWSHKDGPDDQDERFVTVLKLPPVDSALAAVKVAVAKEIKDARK